MPVAQRKAWVVVRLEDGHRGVGVEMVKDLHPPVVDVIEDVGERKWGREEDDRVHSHHRRDRPARAQSWRVLEGKNVAPIHHRHCDGEEVAQAQGVTCERRPQASQWAGHPARKEVKSGCGGEDTGTVRRRHHKQRDAGHDQGQRARADPHAGNDGAHSQSVSPPHLSLFAHAPPERRRGPAGPR